jgi:hypothetical protein
VITATAVLAAATSFIFVNQTANVVHSITLSKPDVLIGGFVLFKKLTNDAADAWAIQEELTPGSTCTITVGAFTNRVLTVSEDMVMDVACWGACQACEDIVLPVDVTFLVNMNEVAETFTTPEVNGTFNNFCGGCAPMSDANSDGIWELTIPLTPGTYEYKFAADNWAIQETAMARNRFAHN